MEAKLNTRLLSALLSAAVLLTACKKEDDDEPTDEGTDPREFTVTTSGDVSTIEGNSDVSFTFTNDRTWVLKGFVYVESGATLTIQPGTVVRGDKDTKGTLIIKRGAMIMAEGTASEPIVFTSNQPIGSRAAGDWGGLIICGKAKSNQIDDPIVEGGVEAYYGGTSDTDNSGILRYVRIEFPGIPFQPNQEINGLTLAAVGRGTTIDHIQVSFSGDDSFEWFGGNVDVKYLVAYKGLDDDFDMDNGYSGRFQFGVAQREPNTADQSGSNGLEHDNDANGTTSEPFTTPVISNVSIFGPKADAGTSINSNFKRSNHLRRNAHTRVFNSVFAGFPVGCLIDGSACEANCDANELKVKNCVYGGMETLTAVASGSTWDITTWFNNGGNTSFATNAELGVTNGFDQSTPDFTLTGASPLNSGADFSDGDLGASFFQSVNYRGAFGTDNWTSGWCNWDPQNTVY